MGPRQSAGKNVSAPTMMKTPISRPTKRPPWVGKVPADSGTHFLLARDPPMTSHGQPSRVSCEGAAECPAERASAGSLEERAADERIESGRAWRGKPGEAARGASGPAVP